MATRDDFLADLKLGAVPKEYDTSNYQKVKDKKHTVPRIPIFYLGPAGTSKIKRPCYAVAAQSMGGPDAALGDSLPLTTGDPAKPTHRMHQYVWVGDDKRTLQMNGWRQGHGVGQDAEFVQYDPDYPFLLSPGDFFTGACNKDATLPDREFVAAEQVSFDANFWLKGKPTATAAGGDAPADAGGKTDHGHFVQGEFVVLTACAYATRPAEERIAYGLPYETQLIPQITVRTPEAEERKLWVKSTHTPAALSAKSVAGLTLDQPELVERYLVRLPVNRMPRTGDDNPFLVPYILPDESYLFIPGTHCRARINVAVSRRLTKTEMSEVKGQTGGQRMMPVDRVTLDVIQFPDKEQHPTVVQKYSLLNVAISGVMHLLASGISFGPLLVEILRHKESGGVPFDILFHVLIKASRANEKNKVPRPLCHAV
jgi:hypothetical protein